MNLNPNSLDTCAIEKEIRDCFFVNDNSFMGLKPEQERTIKDIMTSYLQKADGRPGNDVFLRLGTGGGKTLCYWYPALKMDGVTIVITPLVQLIYDQVLSFNRRMKSAGKAFRAIAYRSDEELKEDAKAIDFKDEQNDEEAIYMSLAQKRRFIAEGKYKIVYVSPESLSRPGNINFFKNLREISMIVVDECHCITQWGYDFRRSYLRIPAFVRTVRKEQLPLLAAFTATACAAVCDDVVNNLGLHLENRKYRPLTVDKENLELSIVNLGTTNLARKNMLSEMKRYFSDNNRKVVFRCDDEDVSKRLYRLFRNKYIDTGIVDKNKVFIYKSREKSFVGTKKIREDWEYVFCGKIRPLEIRYVPAYDCYVKENKEAKIIDEIDTWRDKEKGYYILLEDREARDKICSEIDEYCHNFWKNSNELAERVKWNKKNIYYKASKTEEDEFGGTIKEFKDKAKGNYSIQARKPEGNNTAVINFIKEHYAKNWDELTLLEKYDNKEKFDFTKISLAGAQKRLNELIIQSENNQAYLIQCRNEEFKDELRKWLDENYEDAGKIILYVDNKGIVFCSKKRDVEKLYERLINKGFNAAKYYADSGENSIGFFTKDIADGGATVLVATKAVGMGVDLENIGFVIHRDLPDCIEEYYQQIGRAGRGKRYTKTGDKAKAVMFYSDKDEKWRKDVLRGNANFQTSDTVLNIYENIIVKYRLNALLQLVRECGSDSDSDNSSKIYSQISDYFNRSVKDDNEIINSSSGVSENEKSNTIDPELKKIIKRFVKRHKKDTHIPKKIITRLDNMSKEDVSSGTGAITIGEIYSLIRTELKDEMFIKERRMSSINVNATKVAGLLRKGQYRSGEKRIIPITSRRAFRIMLCLKNCTYNPQRKIGLYEYKRVEGYADKGAIVDEICGWYTENRDSDKRLIVVMGDTGLLNSVYYAVIRRYQKISEGRDIASEIYRYGEVELRVTNGTGYEKIDFFDMMVADAVYSVGEYKGKEIISVNDILKCLSGDSHIRMYKARTNGDKDLAGQVIKSIGKLNETSIEIKHKGSGIRDALGRRPKEKFTGKLISLEPISGSESAEFKYKKSPLYEYAEYCNGQFYSIPIEMLDVKEHKNDEFVSMHNSVINTKIKFYMAYRAIQAMPHMIYENGRLKNIGQEIRVFGEELADENKEYINSVFGSGKNMIYDMTRRGKYAGNKRYRELITEKARTILVYLSMCFQKRADFKSGSGIRMQPYEVYSGKKVVRLDYNTDEVNSMDPTSEDRASDVTNYVTIGDGENTGNSTKYTEIHVEDIKNKELEGFLLAFYK